MTINTWDLQKGDQHIGSVSLHQRPCIAFPNIYQYHLTPFSLTNPLKEGRIGLYLVDPSVAPSASKQRSLPNRRLGRDQASRRGLVEFLLWNSLIKFSMK
ncbi:hypothetical protein M405DRAFT_354254 [Rhizopogon salebrosus TDB-379]|nr:hypothetical protein M405DRAFT_354254 [Rhizopogon salebrosus TDB-379]